ncbi:MULTISPECIES: hypothetical protein [Acidianus]|uniref:DUF1641 domain-containing protein n=1 Tax=Candidatus Acidianus copahuensis TaxID=1160895 RepID=A0A031LL71_9CREN|nr:MULTISPECIES: hypothetical protein [Acidianus]EZQ01974.1 hypothetical protein CM19_10845 [Candidatus Acidianus copahuensis]NON62682.1 hypothetical protein [Acidianus sp. RZ1]
MSIDRDEDYIEGVEKIKQIVIYLNSTGILDSVLDVLKDENKLRSFLTSKTYRAIVEMLGELKELIDNGQVSADDFINGTIAIAKHLDKIGKIISILEKHGVLDVITTGMSKAAEEMIKDKDQSNIVELLASFDDPDVKKTLAYFRFMLKELGKATELVVNDGKNQQK